MSIQTIDQGIATQIGHYADAVVIPAGYQQILVSAMPGIDQDGDVAESVTHQSEQAWENVTRVLGAAGASVADIVYTRLWLTDESDIAEYLAVRNRYISHRPGWTAAVVSSLGRPDFRIALEVVAARRAED